MYFYKFAVSLGTGPEPLKCQIARFYISEFVSKNILHRQERLNMSDMSDRMSDTMPGIPNWLYQANLSLLQNWFLKLIIFGALSSTKLISIKLVSPKPIKPISSKAVSWDLSLSNTRLCQAHLYNEQFRVAGLALSCHCVLGIVGWRGGLVWQVQTLTACCDVIPRTHHQAMPFRMWNRRRTNPGLVRDYQFFGNWIPTTVSYAFCRPHLPRVPWDHLFFVLKF